MRKLLFVCYLLYAAFLTSCHNDRLDVDLSSVNVPAVKIQRFEQDLFAMNGQSNFAAATTKMLDKYGVYFEGFVNNILESNTKDSSYPVKLKNFITDADLNNVYKDCELAYKDVSDIEEQLTTAMRYFKYYFPKQPLPKIITSFTSFNYSISTADSIIAVGLEMYLGRQSKFYDLIQVPYYKRLTMKRDYIIPDIFRAWAMAKFPLETDEKTDLLRTIVYQGKLLYTLDALLPHAADTLKIGFTKRQLEWCKTNEANMWGFFVKNKLLFSSNGSDIAKYTNEGPFTADFNKESPARTGVWIGWQIVRKYMNRNPNVSLQELLSENDAQKILNKSTYKPD